MVQNRKLCRQEIATLAYLENNDIQCRCSKMMWAVDRKLHSHLEWPKEQWDKFLEHKNFQLH